MSTPTETLAIMLQRAKTHMEMTGLSAEFNATYRELSRILFDFEVVTGVDPAALRDDEDDKSATGVKRWYIEAEDGRRRGPYTDYDDCCADADRTDGRIIEECSIRTDDDEVTTWGCPGCGAGAEADTDTLATAGTPYCFECDCEMVERTD